MSIYTSKVPSSLGSSVQLQLLNAAAAPSYCIYMHCPYYELYLIGISLTP